MKQVIMDHAVRRSAPKIRAHGISLQVQSNDKGFPRGEVEGEWAEVKADRQPEEELIYR